jgi:anti-sigma B factor antagonist
MFAIERTKVSDGACIAVAGEVDVETAPRMRDALLQAIAEEEAVVLDLGSVTFLDSTGLSALVVAGQAAKANGIPLRLREVPRRVANLLTLTGLDGLLPVETRTDGPRG